jgi:5-methyltetrahydropteroyltriglutamate--homocysteine methyltransferase
VVGSLLRPTSLRYAVEEFYSGGHSAVLADERARDRTELRALEDEAIRDAMRRQIDLGLDVITDGEFRRWMFLNSFYDAVEGFRTDNVVTFRNARGEDVPLRVHEIVDHLRLVDSPAAREAAFMSAVADGYPFKITFPAPSLFRAPVLVQARRDLRLRVARGVRRARDPDRTPSCRRRDQGGHAVRAVRLVIFR